MTAKTEIKTTQDLIGLTFDNADGDLFEIFYVPGPPNAINKEVRCYKLKERGKQIFVHKEDMNKVGYPMNSILRRFGLNFESGRAEIDNLPDGVSGIEYLANDKSPLSDLPDVETNYLHGKKSDWNFGGVLYAPLANRDGINNKLMALTPPWHDLGEYRSFWIRSLVKLPKGCQLTRGHLDTRYLLQNDWVIKQSD